MTPLDWVFLGLLTSMVLCGLGIVAGVLFFLLVSRFWTSESVRVWMFWIMVSSMVGFLGVIGVLIVLAFALH